MKNYNSICREYFKITMRDWRDAPKPKWLTKLPWRPAYFKTNGSGDCLAVDLIPSGEISHYLYGQILSTRSKHPDLHLLIIALDDSLRGNVSTREFCQNHNIGLKSIIPGFGIKTCLPCIADTAQTNGLLQRESGWFPKEVLDRAYNLRNLEFSDALDDFIVHARTMRNNEGRTRQLVLNTIDSLLSRHPGFSNPKYQFKKLSCFEEILLRSGRRESDHVIHSFRVFLAGCPIISAFYEHFSQAHHAISLGLENFRVEYAWFLAAIFHDIGRRKERLMDLVRSQLDDDEDYVVLREVGTSKWSQSHYSHARRILGSLSAFLAANEGTVWEGGTFDDDDGKGMMAACVGKYNELASHGIISALDFLADIFRKIEATSARARRTEAIAYCAPAALAILLHDWNAWDIARAWNLVPVDASLLPLAALLIYIDTWDDFRRHADNQSCYIRKYNISARGASVYAEWENPQRFYEMVQQRRNYTEAIRNPSFRQDIFLRLLTG